MAFFCPGSGAKVKKEFESHSRRQYDYQGMQSPSQAYRHPSIGSMGYPPSQVSGGRHNMMFERVQDSGPQSPVSTQFFQKMIVLHDHYPEREMELAVRKGEKVEVVKREPNWLFVRNERGKEGYVPARNCIAPVTRRTRSNSRSSMAIRPVMSGEIMESSGGSRSRGVVPMYSSSSAGKVRRHDSPMSFGGFEHDSSTQFQRVNSPSSIMSAAMNEPSDHTFDNKCSLSSSSGVSLMDTSSPALTRTFSQDELKTYSEDTSMFSLSQSAIDPNMTGDKSLIGLSRSVHHKHSSSDDSGTVDSTNLRDPVEYASTIRNGDSSSEECNLKFERVSSGNVTPSMRDRPLPNPPKAEGNNTKEETPPPVPPRNTSLETSRQRGSQVPLVSPITQDDLSPYAQPVDSLINGMNGDKHQKVLQHHQQQQHHHNQQQRGSKIIVDISQQNSGIDSPYSEVYRPQQHKRPINVHEGGRDSPLTGRKPTKNHHQTASPIARKSSPLVNGSDCNHDVGMKNDIPKGIMKFRKYMWGVYTCMKDFEGLDENEVSVKAGEQVLVFNQDDQFWYWVVKHKTNGSEGFVPASILREADDKKPPVVGEAQQPIGNCLRVTGSPPAVPPSSRPRGHTTPSIHYTGNPNSPRARVKSIGSSHLTTTNSIEKIPFDTETPRTPATPLAPSSPPPPYAEQDPILHSHSSQPSSQESHLTSMPRTSIIRNRPPTYPRTRSSTSQMYPSSPLTPYFSQSASRLNHPQSERFHENPNHYPCSPIASTGGTLV